MHWVLSVNHKKKSHIQSLVCPKTLYLSSITDMDIQPEAHYCIKEDTTWLREGPRDFFISWLVPGGLAHSTSLLAVNDEVLEDNDIALAG